MRVIEQYLIHSLIHFIIFTQYFSKLDVNNQTQRKLFEELVSKCDISANSLSFRFDDDEDPRLTITIL